MFMRNIWVLGTLTLLLPSWAVAEEPRLVSVEKIWDRGPHNAFTDLIRWRDRWYCGFREADAHVGGDGRLRLLSSQDGRSWEPVALVAEEGIDLRDPKLSITPDDRLMMVAGGSVYQGTRLVGRQPRVTFSTDGRAWSPPERVLDEGDWLWRVTWHDGIAHGTSYRSDPREDWTLRLVTSADGRTYQPSTKLDVPGKPNETTLRFLPDGTMLSLVRREGGDTFGWIGRSSPPYTTWKWHATQERLGGPNFLRLPDGSLWAAGRRYPGGARTVLARMTPDSYETALELPSGGDCSYPGLAWHDGLLWMSYYSSHEGKSAIYLARIALPGPADRP